MLLFLSWTFASVICSAIKNVKGCVNQLWFIPKKVNANFCFVSGWQKNVLEMNSLITPVLVTRCVFIQSWRDFDSRISIARLKKWRSAWGSLPYPTIKPTCKGDNPEAVPNHLVWFGLSYSQNLMNICLFKVCPCSKSPRDWQDYISSEIRIDFNL